MLELSGMDRRSLPSTIGVIGLLLAGLDEAKASTTNPKIFATIDGTDLRVGTDCSAYWISTNQNGFDTPLPATMTISRAKIVMDGVTRSATDLIFAAFMFKKLVVLRYESDRYQGTPVAVSFQSDQLELFFGRVEKGALVVSRSRSGCFTA